MKPSAFFVVAALLSAASLVAIVIATAPSYAGQTPCAGCHVAGQDFVPSRYPLQ